MVAKSRTVRSKSKQIEQHKTYALLDFARSDNVRLMSVRAKSRTVRSKSKQIEQHKTYALLDFATIDVI